MDLFSKPKPRPDQPVVRKGAYMIEIPQGHTAVPVDQEGRKLFIKPNEGVENSAEVDKEAYKKEQEREHGDYLDSEEDSGYQM